MHTDIYTGSNQKILHRVVNFLNKEINSITIIIRLQTDYKRVRIRKNLFWTTIRDEQKTPPESHRGWPAFLVTTQHSIF